MFFENVSPCCCGASQGSARARAETGRSGSEAKDAGENNACVVGAIKRPIVATLH